MTAMWLGPTSSTDRSFVRIGWRSRNIPYPTSLRGIANRAKRDKKARSRNLYGLLNAHNLRWCFYQLRRKAAAGMDKVTFEEYEQNLEDNLSRLVEKLKRNGYRAKLVRRRQIPKDGGKTRAPGIPTLEDNLLQLACAKVLDVIHEEDFMDFSWGWRSTADFLKRDVELTGIN